MFVRSRCVASFIAVVLFAAPSVAQKSPLKYVPANAPIVIHVRGYSQTIDRLNATLKAAAPDYARLLAARIDKGIAGLLQGRELKGLPKDGPLFVVFTDLPTDTTEIPEIAVVAKVTNYVQFRDGLLKDDEKKDLKAKGGYETTKIEDMPIYFLDLDGYAVVTPSEKSLKLFRDKKTAMMDAKLDKTLAAKLLGSDLSAYVDMKAITKQYGDKIDSVKTFLSQVADQMGGAGLDKNQAELVKKFYDGLFQLIEDSDKFVAGVEFQADGFMLKLQDQVGEKSKTNAFLKSAKPVDLGAVSHLPAGQMTYMTASPGLQMIRGFGSNMLLGSAGGGASVDSASAAKALANLKLNNWASTYHYPSDGLEVGQYDDNQAAVNATLKMYRSLPENAAFGGAVIKGKPEIKSDAEKIGGFTLNHVKMTWDFDKTVEKFPEQIRDATKETLKRTLGENNNGWFGTNGKVMLQVHAKNWPAAKKLIEAYLGGKMTVGSDPSYAATRRKLPQKGSLLVLLDGGQMAYVAAKSFADAAKNFPGAIPAIEPKAPQGKPSYIGLTVGMQPRIGSIDLWLPAEAINALVKVLAPIFGSADG